MPRQCADISTTMTWQRNNYLNLFTNYSLEKSVSGGSGASRAPVRVGQSMRLGGGNQDVIGLFIIRCKRFIVFWLKCAPLSIAFMSACICRFFAHLSLESAFVYRTLVWALLSGTLLSNDLNFYGKRLPLPLLACCCPIIIIFQTGIPVSTLHMHTPMLHLHF